METSELRKLWHQLEMREKEVQALSRRCESQQEKMKEVTTLRASNSGMMREIAALKKKLSARDEEKEHSMKLLDELTACRLERDDALARLDDTEAERNELTEELRKRRECSNDMEQRLRMQGQRLQDQEETISTLRKEVARKVEEHQEEVRALKDEHTRRQAELSRDAENRVLTLEKVRRKEEAKLLSEIGRKDASIVSQAREVSSLKERASALCADLDMCQAEKARDLSKHCDEVERFRRREYRIRQAAEARECELSASLRDSNWLNDVLKESVQSQAKEIAKLGKANNALEDKVWRQESYLRKKLDSERVSRDRILGRSPSKRKVQPVQMTPPATKERQRLDRVGLLQRSSSSPAVTLPPPPRSERFGSKFSMK